MSQLKQEMSVRYERFLEIAKTDVKNTIASYFSPVKAVIREVSKAVSVETSPHERASRTRGDEKPSTLLTQP